MYYFYIDAFAPSASFRLPESHTFQQTLPLPPPTALMGLAGAAMGLAFEHAMQMKEKGLLCGVWGKHAGGSSDLWKHQKIKTSGVISAVLTREILFGLEMTIIYADQNENKIKQLRDAFLSPIYALTAGTSDDLLKLGHVSEIAWQEEASYSSIEHVVLAGDHSDNYESALQPDSVPLGKLVHPPRVHNLPVSFTFDNNERRIRNRAPFTFIDTPVRLKEPVKAVLIGDKVIPLL